MKVLSLGRPFGTPGEPLRHYQPRRGHEVRSAAIDAGADYRFGPEETAAELVARVSEGWAPDCLLCWCPEVAPPPRELENCPIRSIAIVSDWTVYAPQLEYNLARFDAVVTDKQGARRFRPHGVTPHYIGPFYAHRNGVHRDLGVAKDIDIAFAGNMNHAVHVRRGRLLEQCAALAAKWRVVLASELPPAEYTQLLNRARIVFNHGLRGEMNLRCFEAIACGAVLCIEEDNLEAGEWLEDGRDAVFYRADNLRERLEFFLSRPNELERIAANAAALLPQLCGEARLDALLDKIEELPDTGRPFHTLPRRDQLLADALLYASSSCQAQSDYAVAQLEKACAEFPGDPGLTCAAALAGLDALAGLPPDTRRGALRKVLQGLESSAAAVPDAIVFWLNLAFVSKQARASGAETRFLEIALDAKSTEFGGLLAGERRDLYYQRWREALALGEGAPELLWAAAAARLSALRLETALAAGAADAPGLLASARDAAERSIALCPEVVAPYLTLGRILRAEGCPAEAAAILERSLPLTAFDAAHRLGLLACWKHLGEIEKAQTLARESATLFSACRGAEYAAESFRQEIAD